MSTQPPFHDPHAFYAHGNPYHSRYSRFAFRRGPPRLFVRLFWFGLGAGAFALWSRHKEDKSPRVEGFGGGWCGGSRRLEQSEHQRQQQQAQVQPQVHAQVSFGAQDVPAHDQRTGRWTQWNVQPAPQQAQSPPVPVAQEPQIRDVGRSASDTMAEISESALDALLSSVQVLKAKLTENREQREKQKVYLEQRIPAESSQNDRANGSQSSRLV